MIPSTLLAGAVRGSTTRSSSIIGDRYLKLPETTLNAFCQLLEELPDGERSASLEILIRAFTDWSSDPLEAYVLYVEKDLDHPDEDVPSDILVDLPCTSSAGILDGLLESKEARELGRFIEVLLEDYSIWWHPDAYAAKIACHAVLCQLLNPFIDSPRGGSGPVEFVISAWLVGEITALIDEGEDRGLFTEMLVNLKPVSGQDDLLEGKLGERSRQQFMVELQDLLDTQISTSSGQRGVVEAVLSIVS